VKRNRRILSAVIAAGLALSLAGPLGAVASEPGPSEAGPSEPAQPAAATRFEGYIYNLDKNRLGLGIGVARDFDGVYAVPDKYDGILMPRQRTDTRFGWPRAEAFYVGPGYCASVEYYAGGKWRLALRKFTPGIHSLGPVAGEDIARYQVSIYRPNDGC
jgi:hypothetical protein